MAKGRDQRGKQIEDLLDEWRRMLEERGKTQRFDLHHESETSSAYIFNAVFGWKLVNENQKKIGTAIVDLKDKKNRLYVQVSSDGSTRKVRETVEKFSLSDLGESGYRLMIFVLGKKSPKLPQKIESNGFVFIPEEDVFDFKDLTNGFRYFQMERMDALYKLVYREVRPEIGHRPKMKVDDGSRLKRNLALRDKLGKQLQKPPGTDETITYVFEPHWKFKYSDIIIRNHKDKTYPNWVDGSDEFSWCKVYLFNTYDRGLEFIDGIGGKVAFTKTGEWFKLSYWDETLDKNPEFKTMHLTIFYRIAYDDIVILDLEEEDPILYVRIRDTGSPWESILFGKQGNLKDRKLTTYLDPDKEIEPLALY